MPQFSDDLFLGTAVTYQGTDAYPNTTTFTVIDPVSPTPSPLSPIYYIVKYT